MSPSNQQFRLEDIYDTLVAISEYINDMDYDAWTQDRRTVDAVIRNLEITGEAASHVSEDIQKQHTDIPWSQMKALWNVIINNLPLFKKNIWHRSLYIEFWKIIPLPI